MSISIYATQAEEGFFYVLEGLFRRILGARSQELFEKIRVSKGHFLNAPILVKLKNTPSPIMI
jgi:hypothetical protein